MCCTSSRTDSVALLLIRLFTSKCSRRLGLIALLVFLHLSCIVFALRVVHLGLKEVVHLQEHLLLNFCLECVHTVSCGVLFVQTSIETRLTETTSIMHLVLFLLPDYVFSSVSAHLLL